MAINKRQSARTSQIWTTSKEQLQKILNQSSTYKQVFQKIGIFSSHCGSAYHQRLRQRVKEDDLDMTILLSNRTKYMKQKNPLKANKSNIISDEQVFCENSQIDRNGLKRRLIKNKLVPYVCTGCLNNGQWQGKKLSLQLDHINGINNDNRPQNLRFLCPNCHSQTDTYAGKALKIKNFCQCGNPIHRKSTTCKKCMDKQKFRKFNPSKQQLTNKLIQLDWKWTAAGQFYGVNDNSIIKRCKVLGIESPYKNKSKNMNFNPSKQQLQNKLIQSGYNMTKVAKFYNIDRNVVKSRCIKYEIYF